MAHTYCLEYHHPVAGSMLWRWARLRFQADSKEAAHAKVVSFVAHSVFIDDRGVRYAWPWKLFEENGDGKIPDVALPWRELCCSTAVNTAYAPRKIAAKEDAPKEKRKSV